MKIHLVDLRLKANAGMMYPVCGASALALDMAKSRWELTRDFEKVTCLHCKKIFSRRYSMVTGK